MIASFVMSLLTTKDRPYLWTFYRFLDMAKNYGWPIVAQEEYFEKPSVLKEMGKRELLDAERVKRQFGYIVPNDDDLNKITSYKIPQKFMNELIDEYGSINDAFIGLMTIHNQKFEELMDSFFLDMEKKEPIECILTLTSFESLDYIAQKYNTKVIKIELGALRSPTYIDTAFFDTENILGNNSVEKRYSNFFLEIQNSPLKVTLFSRRELLALVLQGKYLKYVYRSSDTPKYDIGVALGTATWIPYMRNSFINDEELLWNVGKKYKLEDMLIRRHPGDFAGAKYPAYEYCLDTSVNTIEFILKCKKIVTLGSNLSFEAKLFGREAVVYQKSSGYFMAAHNLDEKVLAPDEYLCFFAFCYMIPMELLTKPEYIRWRLSNPSECEIYNYHLNYYLKQKDIDLSKVNNCSKKEKFEQILELQHFDFEKRDDFSDIKRAHIPTLSDYEKKIKLLEAEICKLKEDKV